MVASFNSRLCFIAVLAGVLSVCSCSAQYNAAGRSLSSVQGPPPLPPGVRMASPIVPSIHGAGVELLVLTVEATPAEIHEAIMAVGGQRDTTTQEWARGLEVITLESKVLDPLLRSLHPTTAPSVTWLGIPVRWTTALRNSVCAIRVRGWPLSMESGEVALVDVVVDMPDGCRRERLLLPNQVLLLVPGGQAFPLPMGGQVTPGPLSSLMANGQVKVVVLRPRFSTPQAR